MNGRGVGRAATRCTTRIQAGSPAGTRRSTDVTGTDCLLPGRTSAGRGHWKGWRADAQKHALALFSARDDMFSVLDRVHATPSGAGVGTRGATPSDVCAVIFACRPALQKAEQRNKRKPLLSLTPETGAERPTPRLVRRGDTNPDTRGIFRRNPQRGSEATRRASRGAPQRQECGYAQIRWAARGRREGSATGRRGVGRKRRQPGRRTKVLKRRGPSQEPVSHVRSRSSAPGARRPPLLRSLSDRAPEPLFVGSQTLRYPLLMRPARGGTGNGPHVLRTRHPTRATESLRRLTGKRIRNCTLSLELYPRRVLWTLDRPSRKRRTCILENVSRESVFRSGEYGYRFVSTSPPIGWGEPILPSTTKDRSNLNTPVGHYLNRTERDCRTLGLTPGQQNL